jgi:hypothetical protein
MDAAYSNRSTVIGAFYKVCVARSMRLVQCRSLSTEILLTDNMKYLCTRSEEILPFHVIFTCGRSKAFFEYRADFLCKSIYLQAGSPVTGLCTQRAKN